MSEQPSWLDQPIPGPPEAAPPAPPQPEQVPVWVTPQPKGSRLWIYMTGVLLVVVIAGGGIWARGQLLANQSTDQAAVQPSPTPLLSDYERADRYLNVQVAPLIVSIVPPLQSVQKDCLPKEMVPACKPDLIATTKAMSAGDDVLNRQRDIPGCIAVQVNQLKYDWATMESGASLAISGYDNNSYPLYLQGMVRLAGLAQYVTPDMDRITKAEATCAKTV